jgi:hypothetical protein
MNSLDWRANQEVAQHHALHHGCNIGFLEGTGMIAERKKLI